jgi:hypothetical protein
MNHHLLFLTTCLLTSVIPGCGKSHLDDDRVPAAGSARQLDEATFNAGLDPNDQRIVALVSWLKGKGVTLEYAGSPEGGGWWRVTEPKISDDYDVTFSIRSFPSWASEAQMRAALDVNLAYQLNAPAHLAMSYAIFGGKHPDAKLPKSDDELPRVNGMTITKAVERWFMEYKGG